MSLSGEKKQTMRDGHRYYEDDRAFGYIDTRGRWVIKPQFGVDCQDFSDGLAVVSDGALRGYIDRSG